MFSKRISVLFSTGFVLSWINIPRGLSKNHLFIVTPTWNFNFSSLCHSSKCFCLFSLSLFFLCVDYTWQSFLMSEIQHHYSNAEKQANHKQNRGDVCRFWVWSWSSLIWCELLREIIIVLILCCFHTSETEETIHILKCSSQVPIYAHILQAL